MIKGWHHRTRGVSLPTLSNLMTSAIIVAAGGSRRMGFNKLLASLAGAPVLHRTLGEFQACDDIAEIVLVAGEEVRAAVEQWQTEGHLTKLRAIVPGGTERHFSVWAGLQAISAETTLVAVHDGARPLIRPEQISRCIAQASATGAATCARPMSETLKRADAAGSITETIDRDGVWVMETPQVFNRALLVKAYEAVLAAGALVTDEVSAVQMLGQAVQVVDDPWPNPKITFPADLTLAERLL